MWLPIAQFSDNTIFETPSKNQLTQNFPINSSVNLIFMTIFIVSDIFQISNFSKHEFFKPQKSC